MRLIIVADIFGRTMELDNLASLLSSDTTRTCLVDPYEGAYTPFENEQTAYGYFQDKVGLPAYEKILFEVVNQVKETLFLIGFSVGAAAMWSLSNHLIFKKEDTKAICFYGSQIRNMLHVQPSIDMQLYFPRYEPHFNVQDLMKRLSTKNRVTWAQTPFLHGFMNQRSENFDAIGYRNYLQLLKDILKPLSKQTAG